MLMVHQQQSYITQEININSHSHKLRELKQQEAQQVEKSTMVQQLNSKQQLRLATHGQVGTMAIQTKKLTLLCQQMKLKFMHKLKRMFTISHIIQMVEWLMERIQQHTQSQMSSHSSIQTKMDTTLLVGQMRTTTIWE